MQIAPSLVKNVFLLAERRKRKARLAFVGFGADAAGSGGQADDSDATRRETPAGRGRMQAAVNAAECDEVLAAAVLGILNQESRDRCAQIVLVGDAPGAFLSALAAETTLTFCPTTGVLSGKINVDAQTASDRAGFNALAITGVLDRLDAASASRLLAAARNALSDGGKLICFGPTQRRRNARIRHHSTQLADAGFTVIYKEVSSRASLPSELVVGIRPGSGNEFNL